MRSTTYMFAICQTQYRLDGYVGKKLEKKSWKFYDKRNIQKRLWKSREIRTILETATRTKKKEEKPVSIRKQKLWESTTPNDDLSIHKLSMRARTVGSGKVGKKSREKKSLGFVEFVEIAFSRLGFFVDASSVGRALVRPFAERVLNSCRHSCFRGWRSLLAGALRAPHQARWD